MKRIVAIFLIIILCALCSACDSWMGGEYLSITPHEEHPQVYADRVIEVSSYTQLRNALANLVRTGAEDGIISISAFNKGTIHFYVDTAISNVIENTAFGAYAVEKITYEIGTNRGVSVVACKIHYRRGYQPVSQLKKVETLEDVSGAIVFALEAFDQTLLLHTEQYEEIDVEKVVADHAALYPDRIVELPEIKVNVYPEKGAERIIEILFDYDRNQVYLQQLRSKIEGHFSFLELQLNGINDAAMIYEQLFMVLSEGYTYKANTSSVPVLDFFEKKIGDEKVLADVYARVCTRIGLGCKTVTGTKDGREYVWNAVQIRGRFYAVDLLRCIENRAFALLSIDELEHYAER